jgi:hypothetical protein
VSPSYAAFHFVSTGIAEDEAFRPARRSDMQALPK